MLSSSTRTPCGPLGIARRTVFALCTLLLAAPAGLAQSGLTPMPAKPSASTNAKAPSVETLEQLVLEQVNAERRSAGLDPLAMSDELMSIARAYSQDMAERNYFSHVNPEGKLVYDRAETAGLTNWVNLGENIARNRGYKDPATVAVREWLKSQSHRSVMLDPRYRETGVGVWVGPDETFFFTEVFLTRAGEK